MKNIINKLNLCSLTCIAVLSVVLIFATGAFGQSPPLCTDNFFEIKPNIPVGSGARSVAFADFNRDGIQDIITPKFSGGAGTVNVRLGNGTGGYGEPISTSTGPGPLTVVTADFNLDRKPDFAVTNQLDDTVTVGIGHGDGNFGFFHLDTDGDPDVISGYATGLAVGDFNADGRPDIVATVMGTGVSKIVVFRNTETGFVKNSYDVGADPQVVMVAELGYPNDKPDLVIAFDDSTPNQGKVALLNNNGTGFDAPQFLSVGDYPLSLAVGDMNRDGFSDIVTANFYGSSVTVLTALRGNVGSYSRNDIAVNPYPRSVAIGDLSQDGKRDIAVVQGNGAGDSRAQILLGDGIGGFTAAAANNYVVGNQPYSVGITDYNLDGKPDLVSTNLGTGEVAILENKCTCTTAA